jgi:hypothetical protein
VRVRVQGKAISRSVLVWHRSLSGSPARTVGMDHLPIREQVPTDPLKERGYITLRVTGPNTALPGLAGDFLLIRIHSHALKSRLSGSFKGIRLRVATKCASGTRLAHT